MHQRRARDDGRVGDILGDTHQNDQEIVYMMHLK